MEDTAPPAGPGERTAGQVVVELLGSQLGYELGAKTSLETRGTSVIWTSASVISVLLIASTLNWTADAAILTLVSWQFALAAAAFIAAIVFGLIATWPNEYGWIDLKKRGGMVGLVESQKFMRAPSIFVERNIAEELLHQLKDARKSNRSKATALKRGIIAEAIAVLLLSERVVEIVFGLWVGR